MQQAKGATAMSWVQVGNQGLGRRDEEGQAAGNKESGGPCVWRELGTTAQQFCLVPAAIKPTMMVGSAVPGAHPPHAIQRPERHGLHHRVGCSKAHAAGAPDGCASSDHVHPAQGQEVWQAGMSSRLHAWPHAQCDVRRNSGNSGIF